MNRKNLDSALNISQNLRRLLGKLAAMQMALRCSEVYFARCCAMKQSGTVALCVCFKKWRCDFTFSMTKIK